jgi:hypothetical protein
MAEQKNSLMGITSLIGWLFGADAAAAPDATKLDGTTEVALARSLSALSPDERGWITFAEARILFSTKGDQYAFGETDDDGKKAIESFAAQHQSVISFMPVEGRVYFVRDPTASAGYSTGDAGARVERQSC